MDKRLRSSGVLIIASAIIWGAVILACSYFLKGTDCYGKIQNILVGGVITHLVLVWAPLGMSLRKSKDTGQE